MASYSSTTPVSFSPYVAQRPADLMLKVGMEKEKMYQEGYEKIQSSIDKVAGLDVYRDVDKGYLKQKMNKLDSDLQGVAAGDFSDFQLTNSIAGMAGEIANDEYVQAAVQSTAWIKSESARRKVLESKGLTDANNDAYYGAALGEYLNNDQLKGPDGKPISFNSSYTPWTDIIGKMKTALKDAGQDSDITEEIFVTGQDGKPLVINGKLQYADAKKIDKLTTNKAAVLAAINTVFTQGDVKRQLAIDGWATYKDVPVSALLEPLEASFQAAKAREDKIGIELTALTQATNITPEEREKAKLSLIEFEKAKSENEKDYAQLLVDVKKNPEAFKQNFYTKEYKENIQAQFLKEDKSTTYGPNEALSQQNWRQTYAFNERVEANKVAYQNASLDISRSNSALEWEKFHADYDIDPVTGKYYKKADSKDPKAPKIPINPNDRSFDGDIPGDKVDPIGIVNKMVSELSADKKTKAFDIYADLVRQQKGDINISSASIQAGIDKAAKAAGVTSEQYLDRWASDIGNKYVQLHLIPPPHLKEAFDSYNSVASALNNKVVLSARLKKESLKEAGVLPEVKSTRPGMNFPYKGQKIHLTADEIIGLHRHVKDQTLQNQYNTSDLNSKQKAYLLSVSSQDIPVKTRFDMTRIFNSYENDYKAHQGYAAARQKTLEKADEIYAKKLEDIIPFSSTKSMPVDMSKAEIASAAKDLVNAYIGSAENISGLNAAQRNAVEVAMTLPNIKMSWKGNVPDREGMPWTGTLYVNTGKGIIPLTNISQKNLEIIGDVALGEFKNTPIQDQLNINKTKSTNPVSFPGDPKAWETAYLKSNPYSEDIQKSGYSYRADVIGGPGAYRLVNYIKPKGGDWVAIYGKGVAPSEDMVKQAFEITSPTQINAMYKEYLLQK